MGETKPLSPEVLGVEIAALRRRLDETEAERDSLRQDLDRRTACQLRVEARNAALAARVKWFEEVRQPELLENCNRLEQQARAARAEAKAGQKILRQAMAGATLENAEAAR